MKKLLLLKTLILLAAIASAQIIHVPGDQPTIQEGINAANKGDTVLVDTGTYFENINFRGKAITLASKYLTNPDSIYIYHTVIDGSNPTYSDSASVITLCNGEDSASIICGFTITGGTGNRISVPPIGELVYGGGICCDHSGAKIIHNKIINNTVFSENAAAGAGIGTNEQGDFWVIVRDNIIANNSSSSNDLVVYAGGGSFMGKVLLDNNVIINNHAISQNGFSIGGGIYIEAEMFSPDSILIFNNQFRQNISECHSENAYAGALYIYYGQSIISGNSFIQNKVISTEGVCFGGAVSCWQPAGDLIISDNFVSGNILQSTNNLVGPGFHVWEPAAKLVFTNNTLHNNIASKDNYSYGGGAFIADAKGNQVIVDGNKFLGNQARSAGGLLVRWCYNVSVTNNLFSENDAYRGGGMTMRQDQPTSEFKFEIINNTFNNNTADDWGGAIRMYDNEGGNVVSFNNIFWGNFAQNDGNTISNTSEDSIIIFKSNIHPDDIQGYWSGDDNINEDPLFNPGDSLCHISVASICVDAGADEIIIGSQTYYCPDHDIDGEWRPMNGSADIGADEYAFTDIHEKPGPDSPLKLTINPNPSSGALHLGYLIADIGYLIAEVYSAHGVKVKTLFSGIQDAGTHKKTFDISELPDGIYFIRLQAGEMVETAKLILLK